MKARFRLLLFTLFIGISYTSWPQACITLGQNPTTAFPVCGTTVFKQTSVPKCGQTTIPTFCPKDGNVYIDQSPYWYKFTCYTPGTLGFLITPQNLSDDYDWQLFDITGHNPVDVYSDTSLIVGYNWSGEVGVTGTSATANSKYECGSLRNGPIIPIFSAMPMLKAGHEYLLLISHFSGSEQSGYTLSFGGGTASIVNPVVPVIQNAYAVCDGTQVIVRINKKINCSSIDPDGSDFSINGPVPVSIASASGNGCNNGFDTDTIMLKLNNMLTAGTYTITAKNGTDGNILIDNCGNSLATGANTSLSFTPAQPTPMDSISPVVCITDTLQLVFSKPINCSTIAPDGSDFIITGPIPVTIKSAAGICTSGTSTIIRLFLTTPIKKNGTFKIQLVTGSDGNTLVNECGQATPAGSMISFLTQNITTAAFQSVVNPGCKYDTLLLSHNGNNGANKWNWAIDDGRTSTLQYSVLRYNSFGAKRIGLTVSNGKCSDTASAVAVLPDNTVKAAFNTKDTLCPVDTLTFTDASTSASGITKWLWNFGNGSSSIVQSPPAQSYPIAQRQSTYTARLVATNAHNCSDTAYKNITVLVSCYVAVPSAFTPNGDGLNDYLYPLNAFKAGNLLFRVYNRYGQVIFETSDLTKKWDGRVNGMLQGSGTYIWTLEYVDKDTGKKVFMHGTTVLIR